MTVSYPYGGRDLFAEPENYEYAQCEDVSFLTAWRNQRAAIVERLGTVPGRPDDDPVIDAPVSGTSLIQIMSDIRQDCVSQGLQADTAKEVLDSFVAKFEVFRRLFTAYDASLRKTADATGATIAGYLSFGFALAAFAEQGPRPKYLSTLLKLTDALASQDHTSWAEADRQNFARLLKQEDDLVTVWESTCCR